MGFDADFYLMFILYIQQFQLRLGVSKCPKAPPQAV
jgi:hypothetical protein